MHAAVDDAVTLQMLRSDGQLGANLVQRGEGDGHAHRLEPAFGQLIHAGGKVLTHFEILVKDKGPEDPGPCCRRSQCFRLRLQEPVSEWKP